MTPFVALRRLLLLVAAAALAGCGGGGDDAAGGPTIAEFSADRPSYFVGDSARLRIRYAGGVGRIDPDIGSVGADSTVGTPALERSASFRLTVSGAGGTVSREITLPVAYRDRHRPVAALQVAEHASVALDDGTALVIGGSRAELRTPSPWIERLDPRAGTVTRVGELAAGRSRGAATALGDGRWLLTGGLLGQGVPGHGAEIIALQRDGTLRVAGAGDMVRQRIGHTATRLADGRVLVTGGSVTGEGAPGGISRSAEIWNPAGGGSRLLASTMVTARSDHSATLRPDGRVLIVGGYSVEGDPPLAEVFDPASETFTVLPTPGLASRAAHAAVTLPGGDVLILGGENTAGTAAFASVLRFDVRSRTMQPAPDLLAPRRHAAAVLTADGSVLLFGGVGSDEAPTPAAERYAPTLGTRAIAPMAAGRVEHGAVLLRGPLAGKVLLVGGWNGGWYNAEVALYE
ncbi:MAG: kelch repeat-containing protein [Burkholderiaceae bacterium]|nr:kelch repeat-containing protein [Burkholderiaceae bacterium]